MVTPTYLLVVIACAGLWWGGAKTVHGIRKAGHAIHRHLHHPHKETK